MLTYPASKSCWAPWWRALRACGLPIQASWLDWPANFDPSIEPSPDGWERHVSTCLSEAAAADVLLLYVQDSEQHLGALLETGAALGAGRTVFLISPHEWPFLRNHPHVRNFATLEAAVAALMSMKAGEAARRPRAPKQAGSCDYHEPRAPLAAT
jgi:hypothetical protein